MVDLCLSVLIFRGRGGEERRRGGRLTCGDAEVGLVGGHVVHSVVFSGQDDLAVLQEHHPARQPEVRVRPLVDLIGERHEDGEGEQEAVPRVTVVHLGCGEEARLLTKYNDLRIIKLVLVLYCTS